MRLRMQKKNEKQKKRGNEKRGSGMRGEEEDPIEKLLAHQAAARAKRVAEGQVGVDDGRHG